MKGLGLWTEAAAGVDPNTAFIAVRHGSLCS